MWKAKIQGQHTREEHARATVVFGCLFVLKAPVLRNLSLWVDMPVFQKSSNLIKFAHLIDRLWLLHLDCSFCHYDFLVCPTKDQITHNLCTMLCFSPEAILAELDWSGPLSNLWTLTIFKHQRWKLWKIVSSRNWSFMTRLRFPLSALMSSNYTPFDGLYTLWRHIFTHISPNKLMICAFKLWHYSAPSVLSALIR